MSSEGNYFINVSPNGKELLAFDIVEQRLQTYRFDPKNKDKILKREYLYPLNEHMISNQETGWSVAISDRNDDHALIAVSCFCEEDFLSTPPPFPPSTFTHHRAFPPQQNSHQKNNNYNQNIQKLVFPTKKAPTYIFSTGIGKSKDTPSSIVPIINNFGGGIVKFINSDTLILLRGTGFHRLVFSSPNHNKFINKYHDYSSIILDQIRTNDIRANCSLLNRIIVKHFFFLRKNAKKHHFLEIYNLDPDHDNDFELEHILQSPDSRNYPAKTPVISISKNSKLLAVSLCKQAIGIFLMENGLSIAMKKFHDGKIIDMSFFDDDNKLVVVTKVREDSKLYDPSGNLSKDVFYTTVWDLFNCNEDDLSENNNKSRRKQENCDRPIGLFSNFLVYPSSNPGIKLIPFDDNNESYNHNYFKPKIIYAIERDTMPRTNRTKISYEIYDLSRKLLGLSDIDNSKKSLEFHNLAIKDSEPWDSSSRIQTTIWLNEEKTSQLIIGCQSVQVWEKKGKSLVYIWTLPDHNSNIKKIEFEEQQYNSYVLKIDSKNTNNNNNNHIEIKLPCSDNYIKEVCHSRRFLDEKHYNAKNLSNKRQRYFEKTILETNKILKDFIDKHPQKWRLIDIKECIMADLIAARCQLVTYILKDKQQYKLHIPRRIGWSKEECQETFSINNCEKQSSTKKIKKINDLHLAISTNNPTIVKELINYYSILANDNIGWMTTVSEELLTLYRNYEEYVVGLFDQPIFGSKEAAHLISGNLRSSRTANNYWIRTRNFFRKKLGLNPISIQTDSIALQITDSLIIAKPLLNVPTRLTNQISKNERIEKNINDATPLMMTCMVPLPNFTVPKRDEDASKRSILLRFNKKSRFLRMVLADTNDIIYDNPAMEAIVDFKWSKYARNYIYGLLLLFSFYQLCFGFICFCYVSQIKATDKWFYMLMLPSVVIIICMGSVLLVLEIQQCLLLARRYIRLYNLFDVMACVLPMTGTILIMRSLLISMAQDKTTNGFENIPTSKPLLIFLAMTILVLWFELLLRMRSLPIIGIYVFVILNLLKKIFPFLGVMLLIICGFAHTMYLLLSNPELIEIIPQGISFSIKDPSQALFKNELVITENVQNNYFDNIFSSMKAVYFWTNGQWDQIDHWDFLPVTMITVFASFFLVIVMQNIMIAIMSDVVADAKYNGKKAFLKLRAELIAEVETFFISSSQQRNQDWFPKNIYYQINIEEVNKWKSRKLKRINHNKYPNDGCNEDCQHGQNELKSKLIFIEEKLEKLLLLNNNNDDDDNYSTTSNVTCKS